MNKNYILATALGTIIGIGGTYLYLNKKYVLIYKDEYEEASVETNKEEPIENKENKESYIVTDPKLLSKLNENKISEPGPIKPARVIDYEKLKDDIIKDLEIKDHEGYHSNDDIVYNSEEIDFYDEVEAEVFEDNEENNDRFVIIDASEFGDDKNYEKESYTYVISTAHLYDSYDFIIEDIQEEIGEEAASMLEEYSGNEIFLRDDHSKTYIHIIKVND